MSRFSPERIKRMKQGFTPFTARLKPLSSDSDLLASADQFNEAERALGEILYSSAIESIKAGDLKKLKAYVPELLRLNELQTNFAKAQELVVTNYKESEVILDFYERLVAYLEGYQKSPQEKVADFLKFLDSTVIHSDPGKIRTYTELVQVYLTVSDHIKNLYQERYAQKITVDESLSDSEISKKINLFRANLNVVVGGAERIPEFYAILEELLPGDRLAFIEAAASSKYEIKLKYVLKHYERLLVLRPHALESVREHENLHEAQLNSFQAKITELEEEKAQTEISAERKSELEEQLFLYKAALDAGRLQSLIQNAFKNEASEKDLWRLPLTLDELRVSLQALPSLMVKVAYHNFAEYWKERKRKINENMQWVDLNNDSIGSLAADFVKEIEPKLLAMAVKLFEFDIDEELSPVVVNARVKEFFHSAERALNIQKTKVEAYVSELTNISKGRKRSNSGEILDLLKEHQANIVAARRERFNKMMSKVSRQGAVQDMIETDTAEYEAILQENFPGTRAAQINIILNEGVSANAANALRETLVMVAIKIEMDPQLRLQMLHHLVGEGALFSAVDDNGLQAGALVLSDDELFEFVSRVSALCEDESELAFRNTQYQIGLQAAVDNYQRKIYERRKHHRPWFSLQFFGSLSGQRRNEMAQYREQASQLILAPYAVGEVTKEVEKIYKKANWGIFRGSYLHSTVRNLTQLQQSKAIGHEASLLRQYKAQYKKEMTRSLKAAYMKTIEELEILKEQAALAAQSGSPAALAQSH